MAAKDSKGCTGCGSEKTETVDGVHGRRCADCPPGFNPKHYDGIAADGFSAGPYLRALASGSYRPDFADHLVVDLGRPDAAFAYLGSSLTAEIDRRFTAALRTLR